MPTRRRFAGGPALVVWVGGCAASVAVPPHVDTSAPLAIADPVSSERLQDLATAADAAPGDFGAQRAAGLALMQATLVGHLQHRDRAELYLSRAFALHPNNTHIAAVLARFLNMRTTVVDLSQAELQGRLYTSVLHARADFDRPPGQMRRHTFHLFALLCSTKAVLELREGRGLRALRRVQTLERDLADHIEALPDDVDALAMAGNFEVTFAGAITVGRHRRLDRGIDYLQRQQDRWDEMSPGARDERVAPNVRSVFAFILAEAELAAGRDREASRTYRRLIDFEVPRTRVRAQLVALSEHRLANLPRYSARPELLPVWPSGPSSCVACHSTAAELPAVGLFTLAGVVPWVRASADGATSGE